MAKDEILIGTAEAAAMLGLERSVFTRKVNAGRLSLPVAMKASGKTGEKFFRRSDVVSLVPAPSSAPSPGADDGAASSPDAA